MESRKRKPNLNSHPPSSPLQNPNPPPSSIFRDISNFKTPKHPSRTPCFQSSPQFFTASKNTPQSSLRRGCKTSALKSKAARRLKAFELEQSKSARKAQSEKEKSLKSLARSLTVWLNFLLENPSSCGCDPANFTGEIVASDLRLGDGAKEVFGNYGKREGGSGRRVGVDGPWRGPKRQREMGNDELGKNVFSDSMFSGLRNSLQEICSFVDLKERMRMYVTLDSFKDIFEAMTQVAKNIDEGRLKMRASCPIVSDVGMKEKAIRILMSYNPIWLRIGLYIIFGGDSLLPNDDVNNEQENAFLRMSPLVEYDFKVTDVFEDLRDGVRLCRAIALLKHDASILMKVVVPSDTQKKSMVNCGIALQYLKQAGIPLLDEDGTEIIAEDVVNGDKELTLSLLWNMFVHLQLPLLINKTLLAEEISNIRGTAVVENTSTQMLLDLLLSWIQAICETYELKVDNHSSLLDGKAMWCLLDYYFRKEHDCLCSFKNPDGTKTEISIMSAIEYTDAVHNFILSQKLTSLLGNFPEDKLNFHKLLGFSCQNPNNQHLNPTRNFKAIMSWWQDMAHQNGKCSSKPAAFSVQRSLNDKRDSSVQSARGKHLEEFGMYVTFMADRHYFVNLKKSTVVIQRAIRAWIAQRHYNESVSHNHVQNPDFINAAIIIQKWIRGWKVRSVYAQRVTTTEKCLSVENIQTTAAIIIQQSWKEYVLRKSIRNKHFAATVIQSHYRGSFVRKGVAYKKQAVIKIQRSFRCLRSRRDFRIQREVNASAIIIQSHFRGCMARREAHREKNLLIMIQSFCRGWLQRKELILRKDAAIKIQSAFRCMSCREAFISQTIAAIDIQRFVRGETTRKRLIGAFCSGKEAIMHTFHGHEMKIFLQSVVKLQRWWRYYIIQVRVKTKSAVVIQSHFRGWMARQRAKRERQSVVVIQSCWKGYLARKDARSQLIDLRMRMQKSAANADDSRRLINRLIAALSELLSMKSVSGILHTCATLDVATELSQKCCEELVAAGAIGTLLKLIRSVSRSIPDQQVLKHALSTLRNLARYSNLVQVLVESPQCVEIVVLEFIRNKEEGYFIASEVLKKICACEKGAKAIRKSPALLKRLNNLVEELARKSRNSRNLVGRETAERRLREVVELLKLVTNA
ncbi:hypothetical protein MIMGU_mgv1a000456mg [Erythranthe guttata]|uniref:Calponin-homology (CH) domain-containing protein n=1 Tax=Erythranthe guttata TaxID=4155 RepID=A0A022QGG6_ERYGU|nr:hypothetical protein MIMGU_mgv1a000456mg [Erythranthe guttata]